MCHRGEDVNNKCVLCKNTYNGLKHVVNECEELKREREIVLNELNKIYLYF